MANNCIKRVANPEKCAEKDEEAFGSNMEAVGESEYRTTNTKFGGNKDQHENDLLDHVHGSRGRAFMFIMDGLKISEGTEFRANAKDDFSIRRGGSQPRPPKPVCSTKHFKQDCN